MVLLQQQHKDPAWNASLAPYLRSLPPLGALYTKEGFTDEHLALLQDEQLVRSNTLSLWHACSMFAALQAKGALRSKALLHGQQSAKCCCLSCCRSEKRSHSWPCLLPVGHKQRLPGHLCEAAAGMSSSDCTPHLAARLPCALLPCGLCQLLAHSSSA